MERTQVRLYNILLPIWLLWIFPQAWLVILPGNLAIDCAVLLLALAALRCAAKGAVLRRTWWRVWLNGFLADAAGVAWMVLGMFAAAYGGAWWEENLTAITGSPFRTPLAFDSEIARWPLPACASISWTGGPSAAVRSWRTGSGTGPPWLWPSSPPPGCSWCPCIEERKITAGRSSDRPAQINKYLPEGNSSPLAGELPAEPAEGGRQPGKRCAPSAPLGGTSPVRGKVEAVRRLCLRGWICPGS